MSYPAYKAQSKTTPVPKVTAHAQATFTLRHPLAPGDPAATQSFQAAVISNTNASPSGLVIPCSLVRYGLTTGVNQPVEVKCCRCPGESKVDGEVEVDDGAEAVEVILETVLFVAVVDGEVESLALELKEAADNAMRDFSARGTCV